MSKIPASREAFYGASDVLTLHMRLVPDIRGTVTAADLARMKSTALLVNTTDLGQARVATRADGTLVGIRKPLAVHEQPIVRNYLAVEDIQRAVKKAEEYGATVAYPPTRQG